MSMNKTEASLAYLVVLHGAVALEAMGDKVRAEMFEEDSCKRIFTEAQKLHAEGKYIDAMTLPKAIMPDVQAILTEDATSMAYLDHHIQKLHQLTKYRKAQRLATKFLATNEETDFEPVFAHAVSEMEDLEEEEETGCDVKEALLQAMGKIETEFASPRGLLGFKTGFELVSTRTQGMQRTHLWILGGLPSSGKSLLAGQWALNAMVRDDAKVCVISLEMSKVDWMRRIIANFSGVDINEAVMRKQVKDIERMKNVTSSISQLPLYLDDKAGITLYTLKRKMKAQAKAGKNFFILDHLGLLNHGGNEIEGYKATTSWLKGFAKKHDAFILVLCQLNAKGEQEAMDGKEPRQGHIAYGSSGPNQDADCIFIIDRDQQLFCCKNRNGLMNWNVQLELNGPLCRISEAKYSK